MKKNLKFADMLLFILICMLAFAVSVQAADTGAFPASGAISETAEWSLTEDGVLTISGEGSTGDYSFSRRPWSDCIQPYYESYYEDRESDDMVKNDFIKKIIIENGITEIGSYTFELMTGVTEVVLPESLICIRNGAFAYCDALENITLPEGLNTLETNAFRHCVSLKKINIPDNLPKFSSAFTDCSSLAGMPKDMDSYCRVSTQYSAYGYTGSAITPAIRVYTKNGTRLKEGTNYTVTYENNIDYGIATATVKGIGKYAGTKSLTFEIKPSRVKNLSVDSTDGPSVTVSWSSSTAADRYDVYLNSQLLGSTETTEYTVKNLGYGTTHKIKICPIGIGISPETGEKTEYRGNVAILFAENLPDEDNLLGSGSFGSNKYWTLSKDGVLTISGKGTTGSYDNTSSPWRKFLRPYSEPYSADNQQLKNNFVKKIVVCEGFTEIGKYSFQYMTGVTDVELPDSLTKISRGAFRYCDSLKNIILPENLITLEKDSFRHCVSLKNINIPENVKDTTGAFNECTALTGVPKMIGSYCTVSTTYSAYGYTGSAITPVVRVCTKNGTRLKEGTNYTVAYENNVDYGIATVTVKGIGKYAGTKTITFKIRPAKVRELNITERTDNSVSISWKADPLTEKYRISYGAFEYGVTDSDSFTIVGLKPGKTITVIPVVTVTDPETGNKTEIRGTAATIK